MIKKLVSSTLLLVFSIAISAQSTPVSCPNDMVSVIGEYCPDVDEVCLKWLDENQSSEANSGIGPLRCGEFKYPTVCKSKKLVHKNFCIDKYEWPNKKGELPKVMMTFWDAKKSCEANGKRLCTSSEHTFACEGPHMKP